MLSAAPGGPRTRRATGHPMYCWWEVGMRSSAGAWWEEPGLKWTHMSRRQEGPVHGIPYSCLSSLESPPNSHHVFWYQKGCAGLAWGLGHLPVGPNLSLVALVLWPSIAAKSHGPVVCLQADGPAVVHLQATSYCPRPPVLPLMSRGHPWGPGPSLLPLSSPVHLC